jgi:inositol oxygenase
MEFRNYDLATDSVRECYMYMRKYQTLDFVKRVSAKYNKLDSLQTVQQMFRQLDVFIDKSDPDINLPNIVHLYQTAEAIRNDGHPEWMQLVGLIHDLGKCIYLRGCEEDGTTISTQWGIVGDTFVVGEPLPDCLVYPEFNTLHQSTEALYQPGCGLGNTYISYGHDEYLYQILVQNGVDLPTEALYMVRYHSLYAWHRDGCYSHLEDDQDRRMKPWVQTFNRYDLYTKRDTMYSAQELASLETYYGGLLAKYLPGILAC